MHNAAVKTAVDCMPGAYRITHARLDIRNRAMQLPNASREMHIICTAWHPMSTSVATGASKTGIEWQPRLCRLVLCERESVALCCRDVASTGHGSLRIRIPQQEVAVTLELNTFTLLLRRYYNTQKTAAECDCCGENSLPVHDIDASVHGHRKRGNTARQQLQRTRISTKQFWSSHHSCKVLARLP